MRSWLRIVLLAVLLSLSPGSAQGQEIIKSRLTGGTVGAVAGLLGGGYLSVAIIVAEARMGRYIHDIDDVTGWRSAPAVAGTLTGLALGIWSPARLESAILYGTAGIAAGTVLGLGLGYLVWDPPEGKWAGGAIGAGVGLLIGNAIGMLNPRINDEDNGDAGDPQAAGVPVMIRIRF